MKVRMYAVVVSFCLLASGCKQDAYLDTYIDSMRAEYLALEDDYFLLKEEYQTTVAKLDKSREEVRQLRGEEAGGGRSVAPRPIRDPSNDEPDLGPPNIDFGTPSGPMIERGTPVDPSELQLPDGAHFELPLPDVGHNDPTPMPLRPASHSEPAAPLDTYITHIVINPYQTGGHNFDLRPGDDGISLVFEPRNADDQFVPETGAVWIAVLDPLMDSQHARVANWEFDADATKHRLKSQPGRERGMTFKLPWPGQPPEHSNLRVYVRFETPDGRLLTNDAEIFFALPGQFSNRWTPKPSGPLRPADPTHVARLTAGHDEIGQAAVETSAGSDGQPEPGPVAPVEWIDDRPDANGNGPRRPVWKPFR